MNTIDELRRSLDQRADTASDGAGMAERAQTAARGIRKRRRITATAVCAGLVLVAAVAVPQVSAHRGAAPAATPAYRAPGQLTVRPAADSKLFWQRGTDGTMQWMLPSPDGVLRGDAIVRIHDPGTYDSTALEQGERITIGGHPAFYAPTTVEGLDDILSGPGQKKGLATVGWQDISGAWVTVLDTGNLSGNRPGDPKAGLIGTAEQVRLGAPEDVKVPMHFPAIPGGLPLNYAEADEAVTDPRTGVSAKVSFGGDTTPHIGIGLRNLPRADAPLRISAWTVGKVNWTELTYEEPNTTVAGHPARYDETTRTLMIPPGGSSLVVAMGTCGIAVVVADHTRITRADLETMFSGATFDECDTTDTWTRPVVP